MIKCYFAELAGDETWPWSGRLPDLTTHLKQSHGITEYLTNLDHTVTMCLTLGIAEFGLRFVILQLPDDGEVVRRCAIVFEEYYDESSRVFTFTLRSVNNARFRYEMTVAGVTGSYTYSGRTVTFKDPPITWAVSGFSIYDAQLQALANETTEGGKYNVQVKVSLP